MENQKVKLFYGETSWFSGLMLIEQWGFKVCIALSVVKIVEAQIIIKLVQSFKIDDNISVVLFVSYKRRKKGLRENYKSPFQGLSFLISL